MLKKPLSSSVLLKILVLLVAAILSIAVLGPYFSNPSTHAKSLEVIHGNKAEAMTLSTVVTLASTAVSAMPDDTASPLADELSEFSTPLLIVVCILYFEEFMLTAMESLAFRILIPLACFAMIFYVCTHKKAHFILAVKLALIAVVCACIIPASAALTRSIEDTFSATINTTFEKVKSLSTIFAETDEEESGNALTRFFSNVTTGISTIADIAKDLLSILIDAVAILLITSCVIPVLTALLFVWCIKSILLGRMENIEDAASSIINRIPARKKLILTDVDKVG